MHILSQLQHRGSSLHIERGGYMERLRELDSSSRVKQHGHLAQQLALFRAHSEVGGGNVTSDRVQLAEPFRPTGSDAIEDLRRRGFLCICFDFFLIP